MTILKNYTQLVGTSFETPVIFIGALLKQGKVEQYRGIKFGTLTSRWAEAVLCSNYKTTPTLLPELSKPATTLFKQLQSSAVCDATQFGPLCPQPPEDITGYYAVPRTIVKPIPASAAPDELELLNLVITKPAPNFTTATTPKISHQKQQEKLVPVVVFIHGGSNATGGAANPLYDGSTLVERSVDTGKPIVLVHIQYRVGALGWLYIDGRGNRALRDQLVALRWVQKHIRDFGGDPENVSVMGLSAGSCDTFHQVLIQDQQLQKQVHESGDEMSNDLLFRKIALMSGVADTMPFCSVKSQVSTKWEIASRIFGAEKLASVESEDKLDVLLKDVPVDELVLKSGLTGTAGDEIRIWYGTIEQNDRDPVATTAYNTTTLPQWIDSALISDTGEEGLLFSSGIKQLNHAKTVAAFRSLDDDKDGPSYFGSEIIDSYNLESDFIKGVEALFADLLFTYPIYRTQKENFSTKANTTDIYRLYFDALNPFDAEKGSMHGVDMLYLFGSYLHDYPLDSPVRQTSRELQDTYLEFFYNGRAWKNPAQVKRFPPNKGDKPILLEKNLERNFRRLDVFEKVFDPQGKKKVHNLLKLLSSL